MRQRRLLGDSHPPTAAEGIHIDTPRKRQKADQRPEFEMFAEAAWIIL